MYAGPEFLPPLLKEFNADLDGTDLSQIIIIINAVAWSPPRLSLLSQIPRTWRAPLGANGMVRLSGGVEK